MTCLKLQPLQFIKVPLNTKIYDSHENVFVYFSDSDFLLHMFNIQTCNISTIDVSVVKNKSNPTAISISPTHTIIAVGFENGSIFLYSTQNQKFSKVKMKMKPTPVVSLSFISDSLLIEANQDKTLTAYTLNTTGNLFSTVCKDIRELTILSEPALSILSPPVYQFISKSSRPRCVSKYLSKIFIYKTKNYLAVCELSEQFNVLLELPYEDCCVNFSPPYDDEIHFGIAKTESIEVYKITKRKTIELIFFYQINFVPNFLTFFAPTLFLVFYDDVKGYLFSISKDESVIRESVDQAYEINNETLPQKGVLVNNTNHFFLFAERNSYKITMTTFYETMIHFKQSPSNFNEVIDFCKRALSGDYRATLGLPYNYDQKSMRIEESLTPFLNTECESKIIQLNKEQLVEVEKWVIQLSKELNLKNWAINSGVRIFQKYNDLNNFFNEIISIDPDATFFTYTQEFVPLLLDSCKEFHSPKINDFILSLPKKVASAKDLIQYARSTNDNWFLSDILIKKLNNFVDAATVLYNSKDREHLALLLNKYLHSHATDPPNAIALISWLFAIKQQEENETKNYSFPHLLFLFEYDDMNLIMEILSKIREFIKIDKKPFGASEYVNSILYTIQTNPTLKTEETVFESMEQLIIENNVQISKDNLPILFSRIFREKSVKTESDYREALLIIIINENISREFNEKLLPLCEKFDFRVAKRHIYITNHNYEKAFKELISNAVENPFNFIRQSIRINERNSDEIGQALINLAPDLVKINIEEFLSIMETYFPSLISQIIFMLDSNHDEETKNYYIRYLTRFEDISKLQLSTPILMSFCIFLCKFFPDEVTAFLASQNDSLTDYYKICQKYQIYDGCAVIASKLNDIKSFTTYLCDFFKVKMIIFVDSPNDQIDTALVDMKKSFSFVMSSLKQFIKKKSQENEIEELCRSVVDCFVLPFYALQIDPNRKSKEKVEKKGKKVPPLPKSKKVLPPKSKSGFLKEPELPPREKSHSTSTIQIVTPVSNEEHQINPLETKSKLLQKYMKKICRSVSNILTYPVLLSYIVQKFENISIEYTRETFLALLNDSAYDLETTTTLAELFHQDEQHIHNKFILHQLQGIICSSQSMKTCGTCKGPLNGINSMIRIFPCGHAFHDDYQCLPKEICPICNPEVTIDQDIKRPIFAIQGNQVQRSLKRFEFQLNRKKDLNEEHYVPKKGSLKFNQVPSKLPDPKY